MNIIIAFLINCLILLTGIEAKAQSFQLLEEVTKKHQTCLDNGKDMLGCSKTYYFELDSALDNIYQGLLINLSQIEKEELRKDQLAWLKEKACYFEQFDISKKNRELAEGGRDFIMITYSNKADFIKQRIVVLLNRGIK